MVEYKRILVIKMSALGDIIHALPSLAALRELFPAAKISWLVEPQFASILPGRPYVDELIVFYKNDLKKKSLPKKISYLAELRRELHSRRFDLTLDLQGLMKSSLIALLSGCRRRLGYCEMREGSFLVSRPVYGPNRDGHVIERYRDVIRSLGPISEEVAFPLPDFSEPRREMEELVSSLGLRPPLALLFPGAGWASKLWPAEKYAELARKLSAMGVSAAIGGSRAEGGLAKAIQDQAPELKMPDLTGKTDILGLMGLVSLAAVCVGADTGPLHIAAAAGAPTVSLFGPSSGQRAGTFGPLSRYVASSASCSPCFKRNCPKTFVCMDAIDTDEVFAACREVLERAKSSQIGSNRFSEATES
ncbi:MAG: glycosyltransferase family 9 protein [Deltaproteobacteria bacterium]|jgi:heptosyltransferase-1/heptosyltransferase-2|nr:glycosyltransferase family 9 protein [Deltaproteobacteria bacterium]